MKRFLERIREWLSRPRRLPWTLQTADPVKSALKSSPIPQSLSRGANTSSHHNDRWRYNHALTLADWGSRSRKTLESARLITRFSGSCIQGDNLVCDSFSFVRSAPTRAKVPLHHDRDPAGRQLAVWKEQVEAERDFVGLTFCATLAWVENQRWQDDLVKLVQLELNNSKEYSDQDGCNKQFVFDNSSLI